MITVSVMDNSIAQFITVTLIFILVLAITYFTTRWIGSYQKKQISHGNIKIIESLRLSNNKVLEIVKTGDKCFLIAVCKDTVTTIGEINEDTLELTDTSKAESFSSIFNRFKISHDDEDETEDEEK